MKPIRKYILLIVCGLTTNPVLADFIDGEYVQKVNEVFQQEDWITGKQILDEGLKRYPKNSDLKTLLGKYYFEWEKDNDKARFALIEALQADRQNVSAKQILVNIEISSKRYSSAICYINELLEVNPYWKGLWIKKIEVYRLQGNQAEANRLLRRLRQIYPQDENIKASYLHYVKEEVRDYSKNGEVDEAINVANLLIKEEPENEDAYLELCNSYLKAGDYERALVTAERGLYQLPGNLKLITKKTDVLSALHRFDELLSFLQSEMRTNSNRPALTQKYNYFQEEFAQQRRKSDIYVTYRSIHERNPRNTEAFNYVISYSIANGLYDDALETIERAKKVNKETKELLVKEHQVYVKMGSTSKANQLTEKLYNLFPTDADITYMYTCLRLQQAKALIMEEQYIKAINHFMFVAEHGTDDIKKTGITALFNCYNHTQKYNKALQCLDTLITNYPDELDWRAKKALIFNNQRRYQEAMEEYKILVTLAPDEDRDFYLKGYDELATVAVKQLVENHLLPDAMTLIGNWLQVYLNSEMGYKYAINISAQMREYEEFRSYALAGMSVHPDDVYYRIKLAEAYTYLKNPEQSLEILSQDIAQHPYNTELINAHTQSTEDYTQSLIKEKDYTKSMDILNEALVYNPQSKSLKYWKGVVFEKTNQNDSAYHYQSFYEPSPMEVSQHRKHLNYLNYSAYKNDISFYHLRSRFGDSDKITSVSSVEYTRFGLKNTYTGRVNYAGRDTGKELQGQLEWTRKWKPNIYTRIDASIANKYFPKFIMNASIYKTFKNNWEIEVAAGYRRLQDRVNMFTGAAGVAKELDFVWLNARGSLHHFNKKLHYNLLGQGRFYFGNSKHYLSFMGSLGSAPDMDVIDYQFYNALSPTNTMVGLGLHWLINERFAVACLGTFYNYKDDSYISVDAPNANHRNMYNLFFQFHVKF